MKSKDIILKTGSWCGDQPIRISFPGHWKIATYQGIETAEYDAFQIEKHLVKQAETGRLKALLRANNKVAIVIDDHTRPTPVASILRPLLSILKNACIPIQNIKVLVAIGSHILEQKSILDEKLNGVKDLDVEIIVPDCRNANDLSFIGTSDTGIPIYINKYFAEADIKIAISGVYPHDEAGFSGGAKILIGILGLTTLSRFHRKHGLVKRGQVVETAFRDELEHFADISGLDYSINCIVNHNKKIIGLYCGDFRESLREAASQAQKMLCTNINPDADVHIANAYPLDNSLCVLGKSTWPFRFSKKGAHKIVLTSLWGGTEDRIPFASTRREQLYAQFKVKTGITRAKRICKALIDWINARCAPDNKWQKPYVIYMADVDPKITTRKPNAINSCPVEYDWNKLINELLDMIGQHYPAHVAIYPFAPLHFGIPDFAGCSQNIDQNLNA